MTHIPFYEFRRLLEETPFELQGIAEAAGVSDTTVYRWKCGRATPSVAHVAQVKDYHDRRLNELRQVMNRLETEMEDVRRIMDRESQYA